jgi:hypothetical protein
MSYGWLLPDRALLQYGFIPKELLPAVDQEQHGSAADAYVPLFGMDRHDFKAFANSQLPWRYRLDKVGAPELYQGMRYHLYVTCPAVYFRGNTNPCKA